MSVLCSVVCVFRFIMNPFISLVSWGSVMSMMYDMSLCMSAVSGFSLYFASRAVFFPLWWIM